MSEIANPVVDCTALPSPESPPVRSVRSPIVRVPHRLPAACAAPNSIVPLMPAKHVEHAAPAAVDVTVCATVTVSVPRPAVVLVVEPRATEAARRYIAH